MALDLLFVNPSSLNQIALKNRLMASVREQQQPFDDLVSVVIADQLMRPLLGSELFRQLRSPFIRKILISNFMKLRPSPEIDHLRNIGVTQAAIDKSDQLALRLPAIIRQYQIDFFTLLSSELFNVKQNPLADSEFASVYVKLINEFRPDFIWPTRNLHTFAFSKATGQTSLKLFVSTKEQIEGLLDSHRVESAPKTIFSMLQSHEFTLAHEDPMTLDGHHWEKYLRPAKKIHGRQAEYLFCTEMEAQYV